jgi:hypothetical protein
MIEADSEILRLEKRQRGLQRVATAINDLTIYGIYPTNFPKLVSAAEHFKDHIKAEILTTKKRIIELGGETVEETYTDPLKSEMQMQSDNINDMYTTKGI